MVANPLVVRSGSKRLPHSRLGCLTCKRRKRKCDEHHPECQNCIRLGLEYEYDKTQSGSSLTISASDATEKPAPARLQSQNPVHAPDATQSPAQTEQAKEKPEQPPVKIRLYRSLMPLSPKPDTQVTTKDSVEDGRTAPTSVSAAVNTEKPTSRSASVGNSGRSDALNAVAGPDDGSLAGETSTTSSSSIVVPLFNEESLDPQLQSDSHVLQRSGSSSATAATFSSTPGTIAPSDTMNTRNVAADATSRSLFDRRIKPCSQYLQKNPNAVPLATLTRL